LGKENLPANIREQNERALVSLKRQLELAIKSNAEIKMAKRYQMVRFVGNSFPFLLKTERQKATRRLRQAEKCNEENPTPENQTQVDKYTLDLYYTTHFPLAEKYIALYPKSAIENQEVLDKQDKIRNQLRDEMLNGKKSVSGSKKIDLGRARSSTSTIDDDGSENNIDSEEDHEGDEDEFLNLGHKSG
jgi:hypothetical protein